MNTTRLRSCVRWLASSSLAAACATGGDPQGGGVSPTGGSAGSSVGSGGKSGSGGTFGTGGSGASGGSTGPLAGSSGTAGPDGSAGAAGTAGTAGVAGSSTSGGTGGTPGAGGIVGGSGSAGTAGSSSGAGGKGGTAGNSGTGGLGGAGGSSGSSGTAGKGGGGGTDAGAEGGIIGLRLQYRNNEDTAPTDNTIRPHFNVINGSTQAIPLPEITIRYYFTSEPTNPSITLECDYAVIGCAAIEVGSAVFGAVTPATTGADHYLEVRFNSGSLAAGSSTQDIKLRFHPTNYAGGNYNETDDYSYGTPSAFVDWTKATLYHRGQLVWGTPP